MKEWFFESQRKGQTPNWTTANFSAESLTLRYRISDRSNSNDSRHGALVTPVISKSIDTKSASLTWLRSSASAGSKLDFVTFFSAKSEELEEVHRERLDGNNWVPFRAWASVMARTRKYFFILCFSFQSFCLMQQGCRWFLRRAPVITCHCNERETRIFRAPAGKTQFF